MLVLIVLGLLIFVHELGHFIIAKKSGMKIEEFGFGFPPRIWGIKRGETMYSINWIPLGGFVKILGQDGEQKDNPKSFAAKKARWRFAVLIAGVTMNMLLAVVLLGANNIIGSPTEITDNEIAPNGQASILITTISQDSPAKNADIRMGDVLLAINGTSVDKVMDVQELVQQQKGQEVVLQIQRGDTELEKTLTPRVDHPEDEGSVGIGLARTALKKSPWYLAPWYGLRDTGILTFQIVVGFVMLLKTAIAGQTSISESIAGPVGIAVLTKQMSEMGIPYLIRFTALFSVNLAILNILPLPALDGGRIVFIIIEKIKGSPVKKEREALVHTIGFFALILLMIIITFTDFLKFKEAFKSLFEKIF